MCLYKPLYNQNNLEFLVQKYNRTDAARNRILNLNYFWIINDKNNEKEQYIHEWLKKINKIIYNNNKIF